jgi:hypothetical protein
MGINVLKSSTSVAVLLLMHALSGEILQHFTCLLIDKLIQKDEKCPCHISINNITRRVFL